MGTDEGSGWAPKGDRFGDEGGGDAAPRQEDQQPRKQPEQE
jgi:hypothetical protein